MQPRGRGGLGFVSDGTAKVGDAGPVFEEDLVPLEGRRVVLTPLGPAHYDFLWEMESGLDFRFRFRGAVPSPDFFIASLWDGVVVAFIVLRRDTGDPIGLVTIYKEDSRSATAYVAVALHPDALGHVYGPEALVLLLNYAFETFPYRKLYAESIEYNISGLSALKEKLFVEEGRFRAHEFIAGRWWDRVYFAVFRERWNELRPKLLRGALPLGASGDHDSLV